MRESCARAEIISNYAIISNIAMIDRQISFFAPKTGNYEVRMVFPKYILLSIISIASLFLSFVLSFRGLY